MSSLKARRAAAAHAIPTMRPLEDQLDQLRGALMHVASQPDSVDSRAALRSLCGAAMFTIDAAEKRVI